MNERAEPSPKPRRRQCKRVSQTPVKPPPSVSGGDPGGADEDRMSRSVGIASAVLRLNLPLQPDDRQMFDALCQQEGATEVEMRSWLARCGYCFADQAVRRYRRILTTLLGDAHNSSIMSTSILQVAGVDAKEAGVVILEQWMTQFLYGELQTRGAVDADGWLRLSRGVGEVLENGVTVEKVRKLARTMASQSGALLARRMTAREVAERIREVLIGPPLAQQGEPRLLPDEEPPSLVD